MAKWTSKEILDKILKDDDWVAAGLLGLYRQQTREERALGYTLVEDGKGFLCNEESAKMSSIAEQAKKWYDGCKKFPKPLSDNQLTYVRIQLRDFYVDQLTKIANKEPVDGAVETVE